MAIIDSDGLFNGDRLRRCSSAAQLHWPRFYAASNGYGRLELNYAKLLRAYATFSPVPSEEELQGYLQEYAENFLLFIYQHDGQLWGQWDTPEEFLPKYKTASDRKSPFPMENSWENWKKSYRSLQRDETKAFPKSFGKLSETFQRQTHGIGIGIGIGVGVGVGVGKTSLGANGAPGNGILPFPETPSETPAENGHRNGSHKTYKFEREVLAVAAQFHTRHPQKRRNIGTPKVSEYLKKICTSGTPEQKLERLSEVNRKHAGWCASQEWTREDGRFAMSLENWLAPTKGRFDAEPPDNAEQSPGGTVYTYTEGQ